jgi:polyisoprenoid-binding protein YceI
LQPAIDPSVPLREDATVRYTLDPSTSRFRAQAFASGLLSSFGHNPIIVIRGFSGEARVDPNALEQSSLTFTVDIASLEVENDISQKDRQEILRMTREEVFETNNFPGIYYECNSVTGSKIGEGRFWVAMNGNLTLHGVTRPQKVAATVAVDDGTCRASGEFIIRQSDYNIKLVSAVGGALKVKDEVKCTFDIKARKTE